MPRDTAQEFVGDGELFRRIALVIVAFLGFAYAGDYALVRFRIRNPYGVVQVRPYYAVRQKNGKPDYYFLDPQNQICVNSLLPHLGYVPCWYLRRHVQQRIDM